MAIEISGLRAQVFRTNMGSSRVNGAATQGKRLADDPKNSHHGDYERIYVDTLRARWEPAGEAHGET